MEAVSNTVSKIGGEVQESVEGAAESVKNALSPQDLQNSNNPLSGGGKRRRRKSSKKSKKVKRSKKVKKSKKRRSSKRR